MPSLNSTLFYALCISGLFLSACTNKVDNNNAFDKTSLFHLLEPEQTNIDFNNIITEYPDVNILSYQYFYNGGGTAVGDLNNDGLEDIYFSGNLVKSRLYLNKGNMKFLDITDSVGVGGKEPSWKTGVTMADVNGDGLLDIYQCYSGGLPAKNRINQLYINQGNDKNGNPQFKEQAARFGLADSSYSTHAVFFDYDQDQDLDLFLLNHNPKIFNTLDEISAPLILKAPAPMIRVKLFENQNGSFKDVSDEAGIYNSAFTYGLGAGVADINQDGWPDIYISNDYSSPDHLYLNNKNGTFKETIKSAMGHTSLYSMGNDIADINNDGLPDIFTLDMLPEGNHRQKLLFTPDNYEYYNLRVRLGFHHQDMRNMLQLNNGDGTFSEIGQLAGLSNTDWSWAPLFADYDNDGWKDLFVTNGYLRDYTNMDFLKFKGDFISSSSPDAVKNNLLSIINEMPSSNVINYVFKNNGDLTFSSVGKQWGINISSNSNGAAYADLDNDGDQDLVVNNINQQAFIYQNRSEMLSDNYFLQIKLKGSGSNTYGLGAKVWLYTKRQKQYLEQMPARGYQSSISPVLHFGLGKNKIIDSLLVIWPGGKKQLLTNVKANQRLTLKQNDAKEKFTAPKPVQPLFTETTSPLDFQHQKNNLNDFKRQPLMVNPISFSGPCLVKGDVNGDGLEDVYVGGGSGQAGKLYIAQKNGKFISKPQAAFENDKQSQDADALFFDANGDGQIDIYVASGGYGNLMPDDVLLQDRLYMNDGKGNFSKSNNALPQMRSSKSCVRAADFNADGHPDLFVGGRVIPGRYPETPQSYLLINNGKGQFSNQITTIAPQLQKIGMVTDAAWADMNGDKKQDLIIIGEWMPVTVMISTGKKLENRTTAYFDKEYSGWWNKLLVDDLNGDKKPDLVIGNHGLNSQCKVSDQEPADLYYKDFDDNGSVDPILCFYIQGKSYPYVTRDELLDQMSIMRTRFADYKSYADASLHDIFTPEELKGAGHLRANYLKTAIFIHTGKAFREMPLPIQSQFAPTFTISTLDFDRDGNKDLLLCGNISRARLRFGKYDASYGTLLKGNGKGTFSYVPQSRAGLNLKGDVRAVLKFDGFFLFGMNQKQIAAFRLPVDVYKPVSYNFKDKK